MKKIVIDGHFVVEPVNGIPRYAAEIVKRLDSRFPKGSIVLIVPRQAQRLPEFTNIEVIRAKRDYKRRILWTRLAVRSFVNSENQKNCRNNAKESYCCVNFENRCNLISGSVSMIHDLIPLGDGRESADALFPDGITSWYEHWKAKLFFCENMYWKKRKERCIVTVSEYSRQCIIDRCGIPEQKILVIGNGWEHMMQIRETDARRDGRIRRGEYFFFIGNINPHKNIGWILKTAEKMANDLFVIAGKTGNVPAGVKKRIPDNVVWLGYISDGYMKFLMRGAKALLFPSLEEGFGIPPLEALSLKTPVIAADIPVIREIYGDTVHYIDPHEPSADLNALLREKPGREPDVILEKYTWEKAAGQWEALFRNIMEGS